MFNFLLCCFKKKKNRIKDITIRPERMNATEYYGNINTFNFETDIDTFYLNNKENINKNSKGKLKSKEELHKIFLEKRERRLNRKKLNLIYIKSNI